MWELAIVGGGITGLAALHQAQEAARDAGRPLGARLFEASPRLGGKVRTERSGGFLVELGPDAFVPHKPHLLELVRELGLEAELIASRDARRRLYLANGSRLLPLPDGFEGLVPGRLGPFLRSPLLSWRGKLRALAEPLVPRRREAGDESLASFARRRLGREAHERLAEPLLAHLHAADAERLSLAAAYPGLAGLERRFGSLRRGARAAAAETRAGGPAFWSLRGGMGRLVEALEARLEAEAVERGRRVAEVRPRGEGGGYLLRLEGGGTAEAASVVLALPAPAAAALLGAWAPRLAAGLEGIRFVSLATLSLGYRRQHVAHPLDGFGFLVPGREGLALLGATWASTKFDGRAPAGSVLVRAFLGGALRPELAALDDAALEARAEAELTPLLGLSGEPLLRRLARWRRGYPQYDVGHLERVADLEAACPPGLELAGNSYRGLGLADCVRSGRDAASRALAAARSRLT